MPMASLSKYDTSELSCSFSTMYGTVFKLRNLDMDAVTGLKSLQAIILSTELEF